MNMAKGDLPVLIGVGQVNQFDESPDVEPIDLMVAAAGRSADPRVLAALDSIRVVSMQSCRYRKPELLLARRIAADGLLVSELPLGTAPSPGLVPRRNRLIAGLSNGVLVVEAALHSGSLITARHAADFGRDVFAIPGSIHSPLARGCNALIKQGAALVESADDVLAELPATDHPLDPATRAMSASAHTLSDLLTEQIELPDQDPIPAAVGHEPVLPDTLAAQLEIDAGELGARLVMLELAGRLERRPDGRVVRTPPVG
jgi:DNA processing protein